MLNPSTRHRAPILWVLLPMIAGLSIGHVLSTPLSVPALLIAGAIALVAGLRLRDSFLALIAMVYALCLTSIAYFELRKARFDAWADRPPREMRLILRIDRLFAATHGKPTISGLAQIVHSETARELEGQQTYFSLRKPKATMSTSTSVAASAAPLPTAEILVSGVFQPIPRSVAANTFDGFLLNSGVNFKLTPGRVLRETRPATRYRKLCAAAQKHFAVILTQGLESHPDLAGIIRGMLLGEVVDLSLVQKQLFIESGTLHLFSISGLHIAAIAIALHMLLGVVRLPRPAIFALSSTTLWLYVDITGSSPSAVRAVVMVILLELAFLLRRAVNPIATLGFAAVTTLIANPMELFNASFQMSYGIVAALLLMGLPFGEWLQARTALFPNLPKVTWRWWHHGFSAAQRWLTTALGIGAATSLTSAICGIIYFNLFTPGALLVNLILIPISSLTLWSGFLSLLFGLLGLRSASVLFNHAAALTLLVMEKGIEWLMCIPGMFWKATFTVPAAGFLSLVALLAVMFFGYATHWDWRRGGWLPPFAITVIVMIFAVRFT
ncbi:MAG TPA: ComEC/Rec2 family competence protein [Opitutaceae bacterium]|nr:ComEC/Rec2 family competence protein [Opitutaceae bacterium]